MIRKFRREKCCLTFISGKSCLLLILVVGFSEKIKSFETKILSAKPIRAGKTRKLVYFGFLHLCETQISKLHHLELGPSSSNLRYESELLNTGQGDNRPMLAV